MSVDVRERLKRLNLVQPVETRFLGTVHVRALTGAEFYRLLESTKDGDGSRHESVLVQMALCNPDGSQVFSEDEIDEIGNQMAAVDRSAIVAAASDLCGIGDNVKNAAKN